MDNKANQKLIDVEALYLAFCLNIYNVILKNKSIDND